MENMGNTRRGFEHDQTSSYRHLNCLTAHISKFLGTNSIELVYT
jgi:hypothetical protein